MSSGDMGHFDENGLLFVDGRDDDMIVSGGENVFPQEVETLLVEREDVSDVNRPGFDAGFMVETSPAGRLDSSVVGHRTGAPPPTRWRMDTPWPKMCMKSGRQHKLSLLLGFAATVPSGPYKGVRGGPSTVSAAGRCGWMYARTLSRWTLHASAVSEGSRCL
jgi:hypothetical protein